MLVLPLVRPCASLHATLQIHPSIDPLTVDSEGARESFFRLGLLEEQRVGEIREMNIFATLLQECSLPQDVAHVRVRRLGFGSHLISPRSAQVTLASPILLRVLLLLDCFMCTPEDLAVTVPIMREACCLL
ncbi:hypothetical protein MPTK1_8g07020 [Marchantia polymorpha subsp. ruderalis]|uniref:Uncharacterized protein n=1 Tax=Marchantia polymorpha TaxID=3197 RepID=A0A2R6XIC6_MARPO|nr:hypothetical protein MARPO_0013s0090 [Marchantia polymorpha]BBN18982.1 hypothetical protein Mp_8g07020 [Marchantia polymorpha subsp. ruderalis]|eukprot:PTQ45864.1 hypothetical protein MARPO_0013s0090 [Marchantia polymorpha]